MQRAGRKPDRMEQESTEFYDEVRKAYRELAARESHRAVLIDGTQSVNKVEDEIWETILSRFPALGAGSRFAIRNPQS